MKQNIKTVCCVCGDLIRDVVTLDGCVSHGFCARCYSVIMAFVKGGEEYDREHAKKFKSICV